MTIRIPDVPAEFVFPALGVVLLVGIAIGVLYQSEHYSNAARFVLGLVLGSVIGTVWIGGWVM